MQPKIFWINEISFVRQFLFSSLLHLSNYTNVSAHLGLSPFGFVLIWDRVHLGSYLFGKVLIRGPVYSR